MKGRCLARGPKARLRQPRLSFRHIRAEPPRKQARSPFSLHGVAEITLCVVLVVGQTTLFSLKHRTGLWLILASIPPGLGLGLLWHALAGPERLLHAWISRRLDRVLAGFGLFFFHLVFYILLFSLTVSYPMGRLITTFWGSMDLAREYMVYSINPVFVLAAGSWLRWWRTSSRSSS